MIYIIASTAMIRQIYSYIAESNMEILYAVMLVGLFILTVGTHGIIIQNYGSDNRK